jgi:hypothetical protein
MRVNPPSKRSTNSQKQVPDSPDSPPRFAACLSAPRRSTRSHAGGGVRSRSVRRRAVSPKVWYPLPSLQSNPIQRTLIPYLDSLSSHSCNTTNPSKSLLNEETTAVAKDHHVCHSSVPTRITRRRASQAPQCCVMGLVEPAQLGKSC